MPAPEARARVALACAAFALGAVAAYALQRLWDARGEAPLGTTWQTATIAYFWRVATALVQGGVAALLAGFGCTEDEALAVLRRMPWIVALVVLPAALAMVLRP